MYVENRERRSGDMKSLLTVTPWAVVVEPVAETAELNVWDRAAKPYPGLGICRNELTTASDSINPQPAMKLLVD